MRIAALIFGVVAGLCGIGVVVLGGLEPSLAGNAVLGSHADIIARAALLALPALCLFGAGLAVGAPRLAAFFLLLGALGWAGVAWLAGHEAIFLAALPFTFAAAAMLVALFGRRPREEAPAPAYAAEVAPAPSVGLAGGPQRSEPDFGPAPTVLPTPAPMPAPMPSAPPPGTAPSTPELDDVVAEALAAAKTPVVTVGDAPVIVAETATPALTRTADLPPLEPRLPPLAKTEPAVASIESARQPALALVADTPTSVATPAPSPATAPAAPPAPAAAEPLAQEEPAPIDPRVEELPVDDRAHRRTEGLRRALRLLIALIFLLVVVAIVVALVMDYRRGAQSALFGDHHPAVAAPKPAAKAPAPAPMDFKSAGQPVAQPVAITASMPSTGVTTLAAALRHFAASPPAAESVAAAAPAQFHPAADASGQPIAAAEAPLPASAPAAGDPAALPPATLVAANGTVEPVAPAPRLDRSQAAAPSPTEVQPAPAQPVQPPPEAAPAPAAPTAPATATPNPVPPAASTTSSSFSDPLAYCSAVGTIDDPDSRFTGPALPFVIGSALSQTHGGLQGPVHWRCEDGAVRACDSRGGPVCEQTPSVEQMIAFCKQHPGTKRVPAPAGWWYCKAKRPMIPKGQQWPVDARGFFPDAWITIRPSPAK